MTLAQRVAGQLARETDPAVTAFAEKLAREAGACAVLFYGSNLRTGSLEGVLDFYVLLPGEPEKGLWPRVSYREWEHEGETLRAKIATMTVEMFDRAARGETIDSTIWARFVQPSALVWSRDDPAAQAVADAIHEACVTAARLAVVVGPDRGTEEEYWRALFRATYKAEFRVEKPGREDSILSLNPGHFDGLLPAALDFAGIPYATEGEVLVPAMAPAMRGRVMGQWSRARRLGKPLNIARLLRATRTFDGAARYAAWKVHRHTGVEIEVTPWRERHPVLAAPGVLWTIWREKRRARR